MKNYRCVTSVQEIQQYIGDAAVVAFDYETAPDEPYRMEEKAALDPQKNHMTGCSFSVKEHTGIYVPVAHKVGENIELTSFLQFLRAFLTDKRIVKVAHNIAFESAISCQRDIVIQPPVYDTICAAQMTLKNNYAFRKLADSGLKKLAEENGIKIYRDLIFYKRPLVRFRNSPALDHLERTFFRYPYSRNNTLWLCGL